MPEIKEPSILKLDILGWGYLCYLIKEKYVQTIQCLSAYKMQVFDGLISIDKHWLESGNDAHQTITS